jgi:hypothetical protein
VDLATPNALDREAALSESKAAAARRRQAALDEAAAAAANEFVEADLPPVVIEEPPQMQMRIRSAPSRPHARPVRRNGRAGERSREDEDFLKREGYIY